MENPPFEDVFPIQDGDFPLLCLFTGGYKEAFLLGQFSCPPPGAAQVQSVRHGPSIEELQGHLLQPRPGDILM